VQDDICAVLGDGLDTLTTASIRVGPTQTRTVTHTAHVKRIVDYQRDFCAPVQPAYYPQYLHIHTYLSYLTDRTDVVLGVSNSLHGYSLNFLIDTRAEF
jgi:hypothetical protein